MNVALRMALWNLRQELNGSSVWNFHQEVKQTDICKRGYKVAKKLEHMDLMTDVQQAISHAKISGDWMVIVCPNADTATPCSQILAASVPDDARFSGRTAILESNGRVSVVVAAEEVFIPDETPFVVSFLGWTSSTKSKGMAKWGEKSSRVLSSGG